MKFGIQKRFTSDVIEVEINASLESSLYSAKLGAAIKVALKSGADLRCADLRDADLRGANLRDAYLRDANLSDADLRDADLRDADLRGAYLRGADLRGANLRDAYLRDANLSSADLRDTYLRGADLRCAYLSDAYLSGAYLRGAYLSDADLRCADLSGAYLRGAYLSDADLRDANLRPIKSDMFVVLLQAIPEIPMLEKAMLAGKIDGSTYEGECACLCGTIEKSNRFNGACDMRDSSRPIEIFFAGINKGDTPENSHFAKLAYDWVQEFKGFIDVKQLEEV